MEILMIKYWDFPWNNLLRLKCFTRKYCTNNFTIWTKYAPLDLTSSPPNPDLNFQITGGKLNSLNWRMNFKSAHIAVHCVPSLSGACNLILRAKLLASGKFWLLKGNEVFSLGLEGNLKLMDILRIFLEYNFKLWGNFWCFYRANGFQGKFVGN